MEGSVSEQYKEKMKQALREMAIVENEWIGVCRICKMTWQPGHSERHTQECMAGNHD